MKFSQFLYLKKDAAKDLFILQYYFYEQRSFYQKFCFEKFPKLQG